MKFFANTRRTGDGLRPRDAIDRGSHRTRGTIDRDLEI
jgi:hypothetical protein